MRRKKKRIMEKNKKRKERGKVEKKRGEGGNCSHWPSG